MITASVSLVKSFVGQHAPKNAPGRRLAGIGWSKEAADAHARHAPECAPFVRHRRITFFDRSEPATARRDAADAALVFGHLEVLTHTTPAERAALAAYRRGRYASAWVYLSGEDFDVVGKEARRAA